MTVDDLKTTIIVGTISSVLATLIVFLSQWLKELFINFRRYKVFEGKYKCYSYKSEEDFDSPSYYEIKDNESRATVKRSGMRNFEICVNQTRTNNRKWRGTIAMNDAYFGHLAWKYDDDKRISGTKEVSLWRHNNNNNNNNNNKEVIYFRETFDRKYGRELLIKDD